MTFTPTEAFSYSNGYDYFFPNGQELASVIEENTPSIATGFSYGSTPRTNTFKATASGSMAQIKVLEKYTHIAVYKDGSLVFCGYNPTFSKTIKKGVGAQGTDESYVVAQMSFSDYSGSLKDVTFSGSEEFDLYYTSSDNIKVCNTSDTSHSLIHILLGYLDPNHRFTVHFGNMPSILKNTKVTYFSVTYEDKVLSIIKDVLEQAGLAMYFDRMHIYIIDVLEELSGTAINIADIESDAVKKGRSFVEISIPTILMATARFVTDVTVYDSGEMSISGDDWYYPAEDTLAEGSFSYSAKEDDEKEKRYFNFRERDFYGEHGLLGFGNDLVYFSRTSTGLKYRVKNDSALRRKFRLKQKADVLLFKYATAFTPTENWNKEESECDYIYSNEMAQRYANALMYQKKSQAVYIDFYADTTSQYPNGYPINSVISLQGTDEVNPLFLITTKTDKLDPFGGYTYRAIPYDRGNVQLSSNYVESKEGLPQYDGKFTAYVSRDVIVCHSNHTPKDTTPVQVVVNIKDRTVVPVLTVNGTEVAIQREKVPVITQGGTEYADTDNWIYEIEANLFGYDTCQLQVTVGDESWTSTISKSADTDSVAPPIIVPEGYTLVTQFCYGTEHNPDPRWVEDASYTLEDASSLVSDIYWVDAVDGECPLRPRVGMYIWMRQGVYIAPATQPTDWTVSLYRAPYVVFEFNVSKRTFVRNLRDDSLVNNIYIYPNIIGYDTSNLVVTASNKTNPLPFDSTNQRYVLTFNANTAPKNYITIQAQLGAERWSIDIACDDQTEYGRNYGTVTALPSGAIAGDYFVAKEDFSTYVKGTPYKLSDNNVWQPMDAVAENFDAMMNSLASILNDPSAQPDVNSSPLYGWFKNLTVLNALIQNLTVRNLHVSDADTNPTFRFRAQAYDSDGNRLTYPIFDVIYNGDTLFSINSQNGEVSMKNATIDGDFTSTGFATSKASDNPITISSLSSNSLTRYYRAESWCSLARSVVWTASYSTLTLTTTQYNALVSAGMPSSADGWNSSVGSEYAKASISGTFKGQSFSAMYTPSSVSRSMTADWVGVMLNGELWFGQIERHSFENMSEDPTPYSQISTVTYGGGTISYTDYDMGYLLTSAFLASMISTYGLPTSSDLQVTSGTVTLNGTNLTPSASSFVYINVTSSTIRIYNTDISGNIQNDQTFSADNYYGQNAFAFSSVVLASSLVGIKTMNIVPFHDNQFDLGQSQKRFKHGYIDQLTGNVNSASNSGTYNVYGAVFN